MYPFLNCLRTQDDITPEDACELGPDLGLRLYHREVKFIFVPSCCLLLQTLQSIPFGAVVSSSLDIVFLLLEQPKATATNELATLLVVTSVDRIS